MQNIKAEMPDAELERLRRSGRIRDQRKAALMGDDAAGALLRTLVGLDATVGLMLDNAGMQAELRERKGFVSEAIFKAVVQLMDLQADMNRQPRIPRSQLSKLRWGLAPDG